MKLPQFSFVNQAQCKNFNFFLSGKLCVQVYFPYTQTVHTGTQAHIFKSKITDSFQCIKVGQGTEDEYSRNLQWCCFIMLSVFIPGNLFHSELLFCTHFMLFQNFSEIVIFIVHSLWENRNPMKIVVS